MMRRETGRQGEQQMKRRGYEERGRQGERRKIFSSSHHLILFSSTFLLLLLAACAPTPVSPTPVSPAALTGTETSVSPTVSPTATLTPPPPSPTSTPLPPDAVSVFFLSAEDNGYQHLFAYAPGVLPLTRLTSGAWDDITPALSPDGTKLAFASSRNEYFDLYLLDLQTGQVSRLTDSPAYDASPAWSPDGQWIVYETYIENNFETAVLSTSAAGQGARLTTNPASDQNPTWAPGGRQIAFASDRSGEEEIWVANLDTPGENRFQNVSNNPQMSETHPVWSPDGRYLAWDAASLTQPSQVMRWDSAAPTTPASAIAPGAAPVWNQDGGQVAARLQDPNLDYLVAYNLQGQITQSPLALRQIRSIVWRSIPIHSLPQAFSRFAAQPTPLFVPQTQPPQENLPERAILVALEGLNAPEALLHDSVDESFNALRARVSVETGWDTLASLENAYTPLTTHLDPGRGDSWLYTGRAFDINAIPLNVGWIYIQREDYNGQTYWRIYLRAQSQDGGQGEPLRARPWDMNARYDLNPLNYEQGGQLMKNIPAGYWIDLTRLARAYEWQRAPAQTNWRTYFKGALFNEFIQPGGLSWRAAMLQLYPAEILITPTVIIPPTRTFTPTPTGYRYKTPTPTVTFTPTLRPTFTPEP